MQEVPTRTQMVDVIDENLKDDEEEEVIAPEILKKEPQKTKEQPLHGRKQM